MKALTVAALSLALLTLACRGGRPAQGELSVGGQFPPSENLLITGGTIRLGAPDWQIVQALYVEGGRVVAAGSHEAVRARVREPFTTLDLAGAVALPGLIDAHAHVEGLGKSLDEIDLRGTASFAELIPKIAARAAALPKGTWIEGRSWDQNLWPGQQFPHHAELSRAVPDHPVLLTRVDGHAILVNARALKLAGLDKPANSEFPVPGGRMLLDGERRPTGVFVDNACELVERHVPAPDAQQRQRRALLAAREFLRNGLTGVHDMGEDQEFMGLLASLALRGELNLEVAGYMSQGVLATLETQGPLKPLGGVWQQLHYRLVGAKLYMDGALGSRGAALLADYSDEAGNRGLPMLEPAELDHFMELCDVNGMQPAVHAIGDLGNQRVLDAFERRLLRSPKFGELRPRIEHAQVVAPEDWKRFAELGVIPSMQPTHATSDMPWAPARVGAERIEGAYAWRQLDPEGSSMCFGSDCPVEACDPLAGLYAAITCAAADGKPVNGFRPDQRLDAARALSGFTANAARAARQEFEFGRLAPGFWANVTVLDIDPLTCAPADLLGGEHVLRTIVRGRSVYVAEQPH
jgi:predicted amidohydrolase YtcJ